MVLQHGHRVSLTTINNSQNEHRLCPRRYFWLLGILGLLYWIQIPLQIRPIILPHRNLMRRNFCNKEYIDWK